VANSELRFTAGLKLAIRRHPGSRELAPPVQDANRMEYWRLSDVTL